jgi:excinuclease ABC subunit C
LDDIPGIGDRRKKALFTHFENLDKLRAASVDEIADVPGMNKVVANMVREFLNNKKEINE